jgi:SAM-dependent methyltransferase
MSTTALYDALSEDYDRFVDWPARLAYELPWVEAQLQQQAARRVLDVACGTGQHAIALAKAGYTVAAADLSAAMVARARANARAAGVDLDVQAVGFGALQGAFGASFDAVLCLGNSLPHALTDADLAAALADMAAVLRPGGTLLMQQRNFDRVLARRERFMPPEAHASPEAEWLFMRFYDWEGERLRFNVVRLQRAAGQDWEARVSHTWLRPRTRAELDAALRVAGFGDRAVFGNLRGEPFDAEASSDLVLLARRA